MRANSERKLPGFQFLLQFSYHRCFFIDRKEFIEANRDCTTADLDEIQNNIYKLIHSTKRRNQEIQICCLLQLRSQAFLIFLSLSLITSEGVSSTSRGSFIFPGAQSYPHRSFSEEVAVLDSYFGSLGSGSKAYVMGSSDKQQKWHVYSVCAAPLHSSTPMYTMEMCMTSLDRSKAAVFYKMNSNSAALMTDSSGIREILPHSDICDFEFDPCGYSMNAIEGNAISTIHITPEDGFSYASFEAAGYDPKDVDLSQLVSRVLRCFEPSEFSIALHADISSSSLEKTSSLEVKGYDLEEKSCEELGMDGSIVYQKFVKTESCGSPRSVLKCCWKDEEKEEKEY
ncbi:hypothetical protein ACET3Z_007287 [Daucus carota]